MSKEDGQIRREVWRGSKNEKPFRFNQCPYVPVLGDRDIFQNKHNIHFIIYCCWRSFSFLIREDQLKKFTWIPLPHFEHAVPQHTKYNHFYKAPDGQVFKSVTTFTGKTTPPEKLIGLKKWRAEKGDAVANYITNESKEDGTAAHSIFEKYLNNDPIPELALLAWGHFMQMKPLLDKIDHIYATEIPLYSYEMRLAGMADCIAKYDGVESLVDFKTSKKPKLEKYIENYFLQATIYAKMWNKLTGKNVNQFAILVSVKEPIMMTQEFVGKPSDYYSLLDERLEKSEEIGGYSK